jgi:hypothetical protein
MITPNGKTLIGKYLLGETINYATHISVGIGEQALTSSESPNIPVTAVSVDGANLVLTVTNTLGITLFRTGDYVNLAGFTGGYADLNGSHQIVKVSTSATVPDQYEILNTKPWTAGSTTGTATLDPIKTNNGIMKFEAARIPVSSRGFIYDDVEQVNKLSFISELLSDQRFFLTEVGLWSAGSNALAPNIDSRMILPVLFSNNFIYHTTDSTYPLPIKTTALDNGAGSGVIIPPDVPNVTPTVVAKIFGAYAENTIFNNPDRVRNQDAPRYLSDAIFAVGDSADITGTDFTPAAGSQHVHVTNRGVNFDNNSPDDLLKFAFSVIPTTPNVGPDFDPGFKNVYIRIEFMDSESTPVSTAYMAAEISSLEFWGSSYYVFTQRLSDLVYSNADFTWNNISLIRIFCSVTDATDTPSPNYYVIYDSLRFDNVTTANPLYAMSGYSLVTTNDGQPIKKLANTSSFIEFRFNLDVV